ncbi:MAG: zf-TFIIB domain-containing protein [Acidobacteriota bacterium]
MHHIVACPACQRQYDAAGHAPGTRFHCRCGEVVTVPTPKPHDAAVVRCSSCGAPREGSAPSCRYCGATFSLRERDLNTICPSCLARVSDHARFCHHCATPIAPEDDLGSETDRMCPACGPDQPLTSRRIGDLPFSLLECGRCAGIWLGNEAFQTLKHRARGGEINLHGFRSADGSGQASRELGSASFSYRPCPVCSKLMQRRNYGRRSGIIIDQCKDHGVWFDDHELNQILNWISSGGEEVAAERAGHEQREMQRRAKLHQSFIETQARRSNSTRRWSFGAETFQRLASFLF